MASKTVSELAEEAQQDPDLKAKLEADPVGTLEEHSEAPAFQNDAIFYRMAILGLIGIIVLVILAAVALQLATDETLPSWQSALATTALGGLVGLFAPSPTNGKAPKAK